MNGRSDGRPTRIGVTGHSNLAPDTVPAVQAELRRELSGLPGIVGVTCLARGADQLFARAVLDLGGQIEVVLPAADYRDRKVKPDNAADFDELIAKAAVVHTMPYDRSNRAAYLAASEHVLSTVEAMIAVWDGGPPGGTGGTADVVASARERDIPVTVVWPEGARRED
jgi:hypothetical protein